MITQKIFQKELVTLDEWLVTYLTKTSTEPVLLESMLYSIQAGGKRFRPLLLMGTVDFFGGTIHPGVIQVAAALEMIHTYSLIHDDLPAMDNDDLRRGKPTNHIQYGEAIAILAGDGLLTEAFQMIGESLDLTEQEKVWLMTGLAKASGTKGMVGGQVGDLAGEHQQLTVEQLASIHHRKTGALIEYAVGAGTYLGLPQENFTCSNHQIMEEMTCFAQHLGLAFQIKDDILDVTGSEALLGKRVQKDQTLEKNTYPALLGLTGAKASLTNELVSARKALQTVENLIKTSSNHYLHQLIDGLEEKDGE